VLVVHRRVPPALIVLGACCRIWWWVALVHAFPEVLPQVIWVQPPGPLVPSVRAYLDCTYHVL
jgi:hypothetical protein